MRVLVCVLLCTRRMLTGIAAMQCMRVVVCVLLCTRRMVTVIAASVFLIFCVLVHNAHGHSCAHILVDKAHGHCD